VKSLSLDDTYIGIKNKKNHPRDNFFFSLLQILAKV